MSDTNERPQVEGTSPAGADRPSSVGRRRLIKLGASAVPTALTLSSRPVRAWECNSTSAWGSAQVNPTASTTARNALLDRANNCWTMTQWTTGASQTGLGSPWAALGYPTQAQFAAYTVGTLYSAYGGIPTGLKSTDFVLDKLKNGTTFQKYMLVARLNSKLVPNVQACLKSGTDQLALMGGGTYSPPNLPGVVWNSQQIIQYLSNNYIVVL